MLVTVITPSNAAIFPEYIIANVKHLVLDPEISVRSMYAQCIAPLADTALRYLELGQALKAHGTYKLAADRQEYDEAHFEVRAAHSINILCYLTRIVIDVLRHEPARSAK
jgi:phosphoinositide-3-kinase regulatory subunit 4